MPNQGSVRHPPVRRARRPIEGANLELPFGGATGRDTAAPLVPEHATLALLRPAAACCRACHLWELGTQTVFGEGQPGAKLMLVGEQPGDMEDRTGRPFVGPAGRLLDQALEEIGIDRREVYITNVVKHFKWTPRGTRRLHVTPTAPEITACRPWLDAEIAVVRPEVIVCLGATAAQALIGRDFRVTVSRGELLPSPLARLVMATVHPSSLLRTPDEEQRQEGIRRFTADLAKAAAAPGAAANLRRKATTGPSPARIQLLMRSALMLTKKSTTRSGFRRLFARRGANSEGAPRLYADTTTLRRASAKSSRTARPVSRLSADPSGPDHTRSTRRALTRSCASRSAPSIPSAAAALAADGKATARAERPATSTAADAS